MYKSFFALIGISLLICRANAQTFLVSDSSVEVNDPNGYPYGVDINTNFTGAWNREYGISYNGSGKWLGIGAYSSNGTSLTYDYIGGNTTLASPWPVPWMVFLPSGNIGIGTTSPQSLLAVAGTVTAKQVAVSQTGWSDFVFDSSYKKMPIERVAAYAASYKHLPDVPSAGEIEQNGLDLGAMEKIHMQKIEELTLYVIDADKRITQQQALLETLQAQLKTQRLEIDRLKAQMQH